MYGGFQPRTWNHPWGETRSFQNHTTQGIGSTFTFSICGLGNNGKVAKHFLTWFQWDIPQKP